jgi:preprotein translocase subunit SecA
MKFFKKIFDDTNKKHLKGFESLVLKISNHEPELKGLSSDALKSKTGILKKRLQDGATGDDVLPEAFACVREASRRTLGQRHFDVQLMGGIALYRGTIAEMKTGEGKTLAATLPSYLNALYGRGMHIVTVNDYLARRDAVWMGQIYHLLGMSVGVLNNDGSYLYDPEHGLKNPKSEIRNPKQIQNNNDKNLKPDELDEVRDTEGSFKVVHEFLKPCSKKEAYAADITYGTNNEYGFDYLRDNISYKKEDMAQRDFSFAIVDEIDSILIDEARTPLIISAPAEDPEKLYNTFAKIALGMQKETHFTVDEKMKAVQLTDDGITKAEKSLGIDNIYTEKGIKYVHHLENAVRAKALFERDKEYVVKEGEVIIVDEFTGRLQPGRRWSQGLHQAVEAKEGLSIRQESRTVASITFQNYFRMYEKLSGMTGTGKTSEEEFSRVYNLEVVQIPTHKSMVRKDKNDLIFQTEKGKFKAAANRIKELHEKGQPVLVGTASIEKNEEFASYLKKEGVPHQVLNAKNHEKEGEIIAQAGRFGAVTIATNMAGRGVDILLGGNPHNEEDQNKVRELGGLYVIGTERHEARRIDDQLRGRSGRQGDPGESQFFVSMEDSLMRVFASDTIKNMMGRFGIPEDHPIENRIITRSLESAQTKIEGFHFDSRKQVLAYDDVLNQQRTSIYDMRRRVILGEKEAVSEFIANIKETHPEIEKVVEEKKQLVGEGQFFQLASLVVLRSVDIHWMEHLETMEYLRSSVNLRAYGQRDPLVEYKKEGLRLFKDLQLNLNQHVFDLISSLKEKSEADKHDGVGHRHHITLSRGSELTNEKQKEAPRPVVSKPQAKRNDPCPCGSGKKYKRCHGNA